LKKIEKNGIIYILIGGTNKVDVDLVTKLKPLVTTFSEAIPYQYKYKDNLKVGGQIISNFSVPNLSSDSYDKTDLYMQYIEIDDAVGQISLMIPSEIYEELNNKYFFKEGMIILAEGKVFDSDVDIGKKSKGVMKNLNYRKEPLPSATLLCWNLMPYSQLTSYPKG